MNLWAMGVVLFLIEITNAGEAKRHGVERKSQRVAEAVALHTRWHVGKKRRRLKLVNGHAQRALKQGLFATRVYKTIGANR
jgi:hypothetical protein